MAVLDQRATRRIMGAWLLRLALTCGGRLSEDDLKARIVALCETFAADDYPACLFTEDSLMRARKTFRFFPNAKELADWLDPQVNALRLERERCAIIARPPQQAPKEEPWRRPTVAEVAEVTAMLDQAMGPNRRETARINRDQGAVVVGTPSEWKSFAKACPGVTDHDRWNLAMWDWRKFGKWYASNGPRPGDPGCLVPTELL